MASKSVKKILQNIKKTAENPSEFFGKYKLPDGKTAEISSIPGQSSAGNRITITNPNDPLDQKIVNIPELGSGKALDYLKSQYPSANISKLDPEIDQLNKIKSNYWASQKKSADAIRSNLRGLEAEAAAAPKMAPEELQKLAAQDVEKMAAEKAVADQSVIRKMNEDGAMRKQADSELAEGKFNAGDTEPGIGSKLFSAPGAIKSKALRAIASKLGRKSADVADEDLGFEVADALAEKAGLDPKNPIVQGAKAAAATAVETLAPENLLDVVPVGKVASKGLKMAGKVDVDKLVRKNRLEGLMDTMRQRPENTAKKLLEGGAKEVKVPASKIIKARK